MYSVNFIKSMENSTINNIICDVSVYVCYIYCMNNMHCTLYILQYRMYYVYIII